MREQYAAITEIFFKMQVICESLSTTMINKGVKND